MSELIDTTEMYLKTILELEEDGVVAMRARIAERLGQSGPTVSQTVARMERDGLLHLTQDRLLELTEHGRRTAVRVMRKHRLAERLLTDVIGLDAAMAHGEACRWEHVMSDEVEQKILDLIGDATTSPYGNPIPGLEEFGRAAATIPAGQPSSELGKDGTKVRVTVNRLGEPVQVDPEVLGLLLDSGVRPGAEVTVWCEDERTIIESTSPDGEAVSLPGDVAAHIFCL
ncbi:MAG: iron dependent repressor, metal binding and dimerization domain protein [Ornithinimicrobium sp.]|uniref:metal-dependent transcriptional regulator n=1 Tax=Ornithinimicrobium sp. TaxID=1977084 RepID=UPI0026DFC505|nr:metal-dependent transcriptional regulator [Ornithinimicrobium sp.]MDO5739255.1 iron dependent repressor, metal binding and dimerization domain protein [Ornithinimicrobium sp.]